MEMQNNKSPKLSTLENTKRRLREKFLRKSPQGKAGDYIHHLSKYHKVHPDIQTILYLRVSTCAQKHKENLDTQERILCRKLKKLDIPVVDCCPEVSSGRVLNSDERWALVKAVKKARRHIKNGRKTVIVATSSDRFLRNQDYTTKEPDLLPTKAEFEKLKELTCGVPLLTLLHPDMHPRKVRSYQTKWGQGYKSNKGGRPEKKEPGYKKQRRLKKLPLVLRLRERRASWGDISALTDTPKSTAADWVKRYS